jgi:putative ABC transport system permease protein
LLARDLRETVREDGQAVMAEPLARSPAGIGRWLVAWLRLGGYHVRLGVRSLRRDLGLSLAMLLCLGLGSGMWTGIVGYRLREYPFRDPPAPGLSHIELHHRTGLGLFTGARETGLHPRLRVSFPEYQILAGSQIPARQAASFRAQLLIAPGGQPAAAARTRHTRFANADLFDLFAIPVGIGRAYTRAEEMAGQAVAVIGWRLGLELFGSPASPDPAAALGRTLLVEGKAFTVIGVVTRDQPFRPDWDAASVGDLQDALYLPVPWAQRLRIWPDRSLIQSPVPAPRGDHVWASDAIFVSFWAELTTPDQRRAYAAYLRQRLDPATTPQLRSYDEWQRAFPPADSDMVFFTLLLALGLAGAGFSTARLLLAKGLARREELGIHRALGATRAALFARHMIEVALIALPAALLGPPLALLQHRLFNTVALANDIPVELTFTSASIGVAAALLVGLLAGGSPAWRMSRTPATVTLGRL